MSDRGGARLLALVVSTVVAAAVATAIVVIDPRTRRLASLDSRRVTDLTEIQDRIEAYWKRHQSLPPDLAALTEEPGLGRLPQDPETATPYEYEPDDPHYRVCATFALDSQETDPPSWQYSKLWAHGAGRFCYDLKVEE